MSEDPAKAIDIEAIDIEAIDIQAIGIVEQHGSFLLIRAGSRFAVIERRNGRLYPMEPGEREGVPISAEGMATLLADEGVPEDQARRLFSELCDRGDRLAQTLR